jgi:apolipoprotein N-acyltransferase
MAGLGVTEISGRAHTRPRRGLPEALAVASGLCGAAAFPPWDLGPLAFVAFAPLLVAMGGVPPRRAAGLGYLSGFSFYLAVIWWVINTMTTYGGMPVALSLIALGLLAGVLAGYTGTFAWLYTLGAPSLPVWLRPAVAAALWTALEFLRGVLFSGFPWALLGYTQYRQPELRLLAALTGVYGVSAVLMLVNATIAETVACWARRAAGHRWRRDLVLAWGLAAVTLAGVWGYGVVWWRDPTGGPAVGVGLLQGNIDQAVKWDRNHQARTLETYERLARQAAGERPSLMVWPETAVPFFLRREPELGARVRALAAATGVPMLVGSPDLGADGLLYNSAFLIGTDGRLTGRYDKRHLVPFGEYVPLQRVFFFLDKLVTGIGDFGRGGSATVFVGDSGRFSVMICYEVIFPAEVRGFTRAGAQFLVNITNDAWFGRSGAPYQHLAMAAIRAVENGSYLIRAANTGVTAIIAPTGEILGQTPIFTEATLTGTIRLRQRHTPYVRYGDVVAWGCLVFLVGYTLVLVGARRRVGGPTAPQA